MASFISRKRRRLSIDQHGGDSAGLVVGDDDSTEMKLAVLASLHPAIDQNSLLEALLSADGSVDEALRTLDPKQSVEPVRKETVGYQSSLSSFAIRRESDSQSPSKKKHLTKKGKTLHLYAPADIEAHTPCSIIHNFLPTNQADALLRELLEEVPSYKKAYFKLFEREVVSPHTMAFYVDSLEEARAQKTDYVYNGSYIEDVRRTLPEMRRVGVRVQETVNQEIKRRIRDFYPDGKKLKYQSPNEWKPNTSFVNCYDGAAESVGYHSDQLTYLGPRAVIGSLSLGVAREFRVRRIVPRDNNNNDQDSPTPISDSTNPQQTPADASGQIAIHLPHNSLLVMHAEMQEEWKHSIAPASTISPHPIAGNKRINITYRCYKESLHPKFTPKCRCGVSCVLRCAQRKKASRGRYMWMCDVGNTPGKTGCGFFEWAQFDEDGEPPWWTGERRRRENEGERERELGKECGRGEGGELMGGVDALGGAAIH
ncbi:MAG: hypothetical protein M1820_009353 [Bogoriella megaspora]|nr:MAG: hypothetical protein M1820_009353 [Bogoriella megaspora]